MYVVPWNARNNNTDWNKLLIIMFKNIDRSYWHVNNLIGKYSNGICKVYIDQNH